MMEALPDQPGRSGLAGMIERVVTGWAVLGGLVLLVVISVNLASVVGAVAWRPFPGDFELTEVGIAMAVFAFLPYCQLTDANVTADIFTARAGPRLVAAFKALASLAAFGFAAILFWRMYAGMLDQKLYGSTTAILQLPIWWAFVPILVSLMLLVAASLVSFLEGVSAAAVPDPPRV
jgi:TRAP-type C4-dicarboxylate transport system permease small subunit